MTDPQKVPAPKCVNHETFSNNHTNTCFRVVNNFAPECKGKIIQPAASNKGDKNQSNTSNRKTPIKKLSAGL